MNTSKRKLATQTIKGRAITLDTHDLAPLLAEHLRQFDYVIELKMQQEQLEDCLIKTTKLIKEKIADVKLKYLQASGICKQQDEFINRVKVKEFELVKCERKTMMVYDFTPEN